MTDTFTSSIETPIGKLTIVADDEFVFEVSFNEQLENAFADQSEGFETEIERPNELIIIAAKQLEAYFTGTCTSFTFPMK